MNPELDKYDADKQQPTLKLEVTVQEINVIFAALSQLPHRVADPILRKLAAQAQKAAE